MLYTENEWPNVACLYKPTFIQWGEKMVILFGNAACSEINIRN